MTPSLSWSFIFLTRERCSLPKKLKQKPLWLALLILLPFVPAFTVGKLARDLTQCHLDDILVGLQQLTHALNPLL